jgi:hypothetical protein
MNSGKTALHFGLEALGIGEGLLEAFVALLGGDRYNCLQIDEGVTEKV